MTLVLPDREPTAEERFLITTTAKLRESELAISLINQKDIETVMAFKMADNMNNRTFDFVTAITEDSVEACLDIISRWHRMDPKQAITIRFTSPGGSPISGFVLLDALRAMDADGTPIITVALGMAASMAGVLLQAGSTGNRVVGPNSWFMIHEGALQLGGKLRDVEEQKAIADRLLNSVVDILAERATVKRAEIRRKIRKGDWWLDANDCIKFGFADRIGWR